MRINHILLAGVASSVLLSAGSLRAQAGPTLLSQSDFESGTLQITEPGLYRLTEDISFNPHPAGSPGPDGVTPLDAYDAGRPFPAQFGSIEDGKYDPAAFGIGFFAAIAVSAPNVTIDLNGFSIEQSAEHALHQRFFAVIETADQPFLPAQGPSDFGGALVPASNLEIRNGTIGRSSHHGVHGNGSDGVTIRNVDFIDFEVGAVALNGVSDLVVQNSTATNRKDVPIIGTFSNARFISAYVDFLVATGSTTTLTVQGAPLSASSIQSALRTAINNVFEDVITDGLGFIDPSQHPSEFALFHNKFGVVDGNAYGYLVNPLGVAVNGFPQQSASPSVDLTFTNVHILSQHAFINEVIAINRGGGPAIDPIGAVFMVRNVHPSTGAPVTTSSLNEAVAVYTGNVLANAQALVAKAALNNEFPPFLDTSRLSITQDILDWIENGTTLASLLSTLPNGSNDYFCNGDTMFHVNKGVIGFKMDGAEDLTMQNTSANDVVNLGDIGSDDCGNYAFSHPAATLSGYGGAKVRGYSFAGSVGVDVRNSDASDLTAESGTAIGFDVLTDSDDVTLLQCSVDGVEAGLSFSPNGGPNEPPDAIGVLIGASATNVSVSGLGTSNLVAFDEAVPLRDLSTP